MIDVPPNQAYLRFALFDEATDGDDDLDLYVYYCPNDICSRIGESGSETSAEEVSLVTASMQANDQQRMAKLTDELDPNYRPHAKKLASEKGIEADLEAYFAA